MPTGMIVPPISGPGNGAAPETNQSTKEWALRGTLTSGRVAVALSAAALFCAIGGGAYAAASSSKTVTVCVKHSGGELYQAKKCAKRDKKLSWNEKGVAGAVGATGAAGAPGAAGTPGAAGPGAKLISADVAVGSSSTGTIDGTWSYTLTCITDSPDDEATVSLTGPGTVAWTSAFNTQAETSTPAMGISSYSLAVIGGPADETLWLQSGTTAAEGHMLVWASTSCNVVGSATPLTS
jgi:hypothetical protein